ncbi:hypothetical protein [Streptomyces anulatus]|uniref:hypothetical protein n=1 Tax=Streptomyces anulatus TaxID=1892 RepID=UPI003F4A3274
MSGQGAGLEVPWSRRHRERLLCWYPTSEYLTGSWLICLTSRYLTSGHLMSTWLMPGT